MANLILTTLTKYLFMLSPSLKSLPLYPNSDPFDFVIFPPNIIPKTLANRLKSVYPSIISLL